MRLALHWPLFETSLTAEAGEGETGSEQDHDTAGETGSEEN